MNVYNLDEAMEFFLGNSTGTITCIKENRGTLNKEKKECCCYPEAKEFFGILGE